MKKKKLEVKLEKTRKKLAATKSKLASVLSELETNGAGSKNNSDRKPLPTVSRAAKRTAPPEAKKKSAAQPTSNATSARKRTKNK
jgi:hypothetical protein